MLKTGIKIIILCGLINNIVIAKPEITADTQSEMHDRVNEKIYNYADRIIMSEQYIRYCYMEMHLHTHMHPTNGFVPFGVNYNDIKTIEKMNYILSTREIYETSFLTLCLAKAKNNLSEADK